MSATLAFERAGLDDLLGALTERGYTLIGRSATDLPNGATDDQESSHLVAVQPGSTRPVGVVSAFGLTAIPWGRS